MKNIILSRKNPEFKSKKFTEDMKYFYTEIINDLVKDPAEKLKVFDKTARIFRPERSEE